MMTFSEWTNYQHDRYNERNIITRIKFWAPVSTRCIPKEHRSMTTVNKIQENAISFNKSSYSHRRHIEMRFYMLDSFGCCPDFTRTETNFFFFKKLWK